MTLLGLLSGCATVSRPVPIPPDRCWSDQEQLRERIRSYSTVTENQTLRAAERLLRLAGRDDMKISHSQHSITAEFNRNRWVYLFLIAHSATVWDHWIITTRPDSGAVSICVHIRGQYFTDTFVLGSEPMNNAIYPASATEQDPGRFFKPPARAYAVDFDTFWSRLEYLLGLNSEWARCPPGSSGGIRKNTFSNRLEINPLCHSLVNDPAPPQANGK